MMQHLFGPALSIWTSRILLRDSVKVALRQRYAGSALGLFWVLLGPTLLLALYAVIYLFIFRVRPMEMSAEAYVLYIFCGLVPFMFFSQGLMQATTSLSADKGLLLNTVYPPELVPFREVLTALTPLVVGLLIIAGLGAVLGKTSVTWLWAPVFVVLLTMFLSGVAWVFCLANLVLKDVQQLLTYITIILLICSPIAYTPDMLPASMEVLIYINPLAYFIVSLQSVIVMGVLPPWPIIVGTVAFALLSLGLGAFIFSRAKLVFFDYA